VVKEYHQSKNHFWNDEHRVQPYCIRRKTIDRSPFFDFDADFYDQKIKVSNKYIRPEQNSIPVDLLTNNWKR
jgi:hypothetical protein